MALNLGEIGQVATWGAAISTASQPAAGIVLSVKLSTIQGYNQYGDVAWTGLTYNAGKLDLELDRFYFGLSTELPNIKKALAIDRIGAAVWKEEGLAVGVVVICVVR